MKATTGVRVLCGLPAPFARVVDGSDSLTLNKEDRLLIAEATGKGATPRIRRRMARLLPRIGIPYAEARELMGVNGGRCSSPRDY